MPPANALRNLKAARKMIGSWSIFSHEERLRELDLFSLEKTTERGPH